MLKKDPSRSSSQISDVFASSEGIENIGFSYIDQTSIESIDSNTLPASYKDKGHEQNCTIYLKNSDSSYQTSHQNKNLTIDSTSSDISLPKTSFKFFSSPKFMKKLTSPKLDKKNIFKSKKQAKEMKKAELKESSQTDRKFFGSPILAKALFRSPKTEKKVITVSSGVQTDSPLSTETSLDSNKPFHDLNRNENVTVTGLSDKLKPNIESHEAEIATSKSSSCSSLNSVASNNLSPLTNSVYYMETRTKPHITVSLPLVSEKNADIRISPSDMSRTPLKPMMGISMLSKKRLPSISGESSISVSSSKSSQDGSTKDATQLPSEVCLDINGDEEGIQALETLQSVNISNSTVPISEASESSDDYS